MVRSLLLALALARAAALLDSPGDSPGHSPGLRGTPISEAAEPAGQYAAVHNQCRGASPPTAQSRPPRYRCERIRLTGLFAHRYSVRKKGRTLDFGYQDNFFVGPLDDPFNDAMKAKGYVCDNTKDKVEQEVSRLLRDYLEGQFRAAHPEYSDEEVSISVDWIGRRDSTASGSGHL